MAFADEYLREAELLCRKTIKIMSLAYKVFSSSRGGPSTSTNLDGAVPSQEASTLVAGVARYVKLLVGIGLRAAAKLQTDGLAEAQLDEALQPLEHPRAWTKLARELDARLDTSSVLSPDSGVFAQADQCMSCRGPVEERCFSCQTEGGRRFRHVQCLRCIACGRRGAYDRGQDGPAGRFHEWTMQCKFCGVAPEEGTYVWYSTVDLYTVLLYIALERLMQLLKEGGT